MEPPGQITAEALREAFERGAIRPHFQPEVTCSARDLAGFQATARWRHPRLGLLATERFHNLARDAGLLGPLTRRVLEDAFAWLAASFPETGVTLSVRLTPAMLGDLDLPDWVSRLCYRLELDPGRVVFFVAATEAHGMASPVERAALRLRLLGFRFAVSDLGPGASIAQLAQLPLSELGISQRIVAQAADSEESRGAVADVIRMARTVRLPVMADGVRDAWSLDFLDRLGCDTARGPLIGEPMEAATALAWRDAHLRRLDR